MYGGCLIIYDGGKGIVCHSQHYYLLRVNKLVYLKLNHFRASFILCFSLNSSVVSDPLVVNFEMKFCLSNEGD